MLSGNMFSDNIVLSDNILSDNIILSDFQVTSLIFSY
jgi:hypothetical protein